MTATASDGSVVEYREKVLRTYGELSGDLHLVDLDRGATCSSLGLCLGGNRDLGTMSVFVVGMQPGGCAASDGRIHLGDELLEINGHVLYGRSHLNASAIIKSVTSRHVQVLLLRAEDSTQRMAVCQRNQLTVDYKDSSSTLVPKKTKSMSMDESQPLEDVKSVDVDESLTTTCSALRSLATRVEAEKVSSSVPPAVEIPSPTDSVKVNLKCGVADATVVQSVPGVRLSPAISSSANSSKHLLEKRAQVDDQSFDDSESADRLCALPADNVNVNCNAGRAPDVGTTVPTASSRWQPADSANSSETSPDESPLRHSPLVRQDPTTCPVSPGHPTRIDICKGKRGLGIRIIGGSDTVLKAILVYEMFDEGAAAKDNRLSPCDQILEVNGNDLQNATHAHAVHVLRHALADMLTMLVLRAESRIPDAEIRDLITVDLVKKPGKGLGLSIVSRWKNSGVLIADIVKGGTAESDGRLFIGDQILKVNGEDLSNATQEFAAAFLKTLMGKVSLTIARLKPGLMPGQRSVGGCLSMRKSDSMAADCKHGVKVNNKRRQTRSCVISGSGCVGRRPDSGDFSDDGEMRSS